MIGTDQRTSRTIAVEAADWFVAMQAEELGNAERVAFSTWLAQSAVHVNEYLELASVWNELGSHAKRPREDKSARMSALLYAARCDIGGSNVIAGPGALRCAEGDPEPVVRSQGPRQTFFGWSRAASVLATVVLVALGAVGGGVAIDRYLHGARYATAVGEQIAFSLGDGSVVRLNTQSVLRARITRNYRDIELLRGEALFEVAKDPRRPFRVRAGSTVVQAIGTVFNVYREVGQSTVTVIEGVVRVETPKGSSDSGSAALPSGTDVTELRANQQAAVTTRGEVSRVNSIAPERVTAWTERRLMFSGERLSEVVAEFNRYNASQIQVDGELAQLQISGVFSATDTESLVEFLEHTEHVTVRELDDGTRVLGRVMDQVTSP